MFNLIGKIQRLCIKRPADVGLADQLVEVVDAGGGGAGGVGEPAEVGGVQPHDLGEQM